MPNFLKNEDFLPPDTYSVSGGKKCSFFGKFGMLCFLETPFLRFVLSPYYRRLIHFFSYTFADKKQYPMFLLHLLSTSFLLHFVKNCLLQMSSDYLLKAWCQKPNPCSWTVKNHHVINSLEQLQKNETITRKFSSNGQDTLP